MNNIMKSPTSIVFLLLTVAVIYLTIAGIVEAKEFIFLTGMAYMHYFKRTSDDTKIG